MNISSNADNTPNQLTNLLPSEFANQPAQPQTSSEPPSIQRIEEETKQEIKENDEEDILEISFEGQKEQKPPKVSLKRRVKQHENAMLSEKGKISLLPLGDELNDNVQTSLKIKGEGIEFQRIRCLMATGPRNYKPKEYFPNINSYISSPNIIDAEIWISSEKNDVILVYKRRNQFGREFNERVRVAPGFLLKIEVLYSEVVESFGKVVRKWVWCRDCDGQLRQFKSY